MAENVDRREAFPIMDVKRFSGDMPQQDDMTVVVIKYQLPAANF